MKTARGGKPSRTQPAQFGTTSGARLKRILLALTVAAVIGLSLVLWLGLKAQSIKVHLVSATSLVLELKSDVLQNNASAATGVLAELRNQTSEARRAAEDPVWKLAGMMPWIGANFRAAEEVAVSADDVTERGVVPLVEVFGTLDWKALAPDSDGIDIAPLASATSKLSAAAHAVRESSDRLNGIDQSELLPQLAAPLAQGREMLASVRDGLDGAADMSFVAPTMLGVEAPKSYLLLVQNNAESRASGGIPGALAVLNVNNGKLSLGTQSSAADLGAFTPSLPVDPDQQQIYSTRLGKYMQDVNLTPDFPTAASTARAMWEKSTGHRVDGVISIDPVVLGYILQSTGRVTVSESVLPAVKAAGLPTELTGNNVVPTLLSDVYSKIQQPKLQDAYFASVAKEVFAALSSGRAEAEGLIAGITRGTKEGRVLMWSADSSEQAVISKYSLSGSISGPSVPPAQFGVYFNDGTGAKMDYYVKRTVQLISKCPQNGYEQIGVRVTSSNTAPPDAATSLPNYVTGAGLFGVSAGSVQTNIIVYGPVQANVESATTGGEKIPFASYLHATRPVGVVAQQLAPGESKTIEFAFGKIVQHTEPSVVVTPTVQDPKDVVLPAERESCTHEQ